MAEFLVQGNRITFYQNLVKSIPSIKLKTIKEARYLCGVLKEAHISREIEEALNVLFSFEIEGVIPIEFIVGNRLIFTQFFRRLILSK